MTNYNNLSETELQTVIEQAEQALKEKQELKHKDVVLQIKALADSIGITVSINDGVNKSPRKGKKVLPKYRNPDNSQTWSGRGVMPKWMQVFVDKGQNKSEFLIK